MGLNGGKLPSGFNAKISPFKRISLQFLNNILFDSEGKINYYQLQCTWTLNNPL